MIEKQDLTCSKVREDRPLCEKMAAYLPAESKDCIVIYGGSIDQEKVSIKDLSISRHKVFKDKRGVVEVLIP